MALNIRTPGVYIVEESKLPASVVPVETAIPAFFGYTESTRYRGENLINRPVAVNSLLEFQEIFGAPPAIGGFPVELDADDKVIGRIADPNTSANARFRLAYALRSFYDNGGGRCYIVSIGDYTASAAPSEIADAHTEGLAALAREDEPTLLVFPDLSGMKPAPENPDDADEVAAAVAAVRATYHGVLIQALNQCATLGDRFLICDLWDGSAAGDAGITAFRNGIGTRSLKYGAVYHPFIQTTMAWNWEESTITVSQIARRNDDGSLGPSPHNGTLAELKSDPAKVNPAIYANIHKELGRYSVTLPPAAAVAGVYCTVDRTRGVWKSPANESLASVRDLAVKIDDDFNGAMNIDQTGKSINALRFFSGKGFLVWGARTLAGNDNEWRYVSVRRFFNMVEESTKKATEPFVFEPNDLGTWIKVKAMIENFLTVQWREGALAGAKPEDAFYVRVGLGTTMTVQNILEGQMIVEIGMAVVRPAEFIILRFSHKMQES